MDNTHSYNGSLTAEQFLFYEIRIAAKMYLDGKKIEEAVEEIKKDNLFQYPTERQVSRLARACYKRMDALDNEGRSVTAGQCREVRGFTFHVLGRPVRSEGAGSLEIRPRSTTGEHSGCVECFSRAHVPRSLGLELGQGLLGAAGSEGSDGSQLINRDDEVVATRWRHMSIVHFCWPRRRLVTQWCAEASRGVGKDVVLASGRWRGRAGRRRVCSRNDSHP